MKRQARWFWLCGFVLLCALPTSANAADANALDNAFDPIAGVREFSGRLIVRPKQVATLRAHGFNERQATKRTEQALRRLAPHLVKRYEDVNECVITVPGGASEKQFAAALMATGDYEYVEPDWIVTPAGLQPNDLYYIDQWYLPHIGVDWAWLVTQGEASVIVAVVDTGIDVTHPDLTGAFVPGYNVVSDLAQTDGGTISDIYGHGTRVAGIVAASGNNGIGVCGVAWDLSIMPIRATNSTNGSAHISDLNAGSRWAVEHGAKVINVSYNGVNTASIQTTGEYIRSQGGLLVWAVGNGAFELAGNDHEDVLIVGGTDSFDNLYFNSNIGELVDLVAPGTPIRTTLSGGGYTYVSGTSYAAPIVTGVAALMWSATPSLTPYEIENALKATAIDLGEPGEDIYFGVGRIDAFEALKMSRNCPADFVTSATSQPPPDGKVDGADLAYLLNEWGNVSRSLADFAASDTFTFPVDGRVDGADLALLLGAWGNCP